MVLISSYEIVSVKSIYFVIEIISDNITVLAIRSTRFYLFLGL